MVFSTCSTSTSSNTSTAPCPPSSMVVRLQSSAASFIRCLPTTVEPVKLSLRMIGEASRWRDTSSGTPNTACPTSLGSPASSRHCSTASAEPGASSAALRITEQPAAIGAPSLRPGIADREIPGCEGGHRADRLVRHGRAHAGRAHQLPAVEALRTRRRRNRTGRRSSCTSMRASASVLPSSSVAMRAISSCRSRISRAAPASTAARCCGAASRHMLKAALRRLRARGRDPPRRPAAARPSASPVAGLTTACVRRLPDGDPLAVDDHVQFGVSSRLGAPRLECLEPLDLAPVGLDAARDAERGERHQDRGGQHDGSSTGRHRSETPVA